MTSKDTVLRHRYTVIPRAAALGNVSQACRPTCASTTASARVRVPPQGAHAGIRVFSVDQPRESCHGGSRR